MPPTVVAHNINVADPQKHPDDARCSCGAKSPKSKNRTILMLWAYGHLHEMLMANGKK